MPKGESQVDPKPEPKSDRENKLDRAYARRENLFGRVQMCLEAGKDLKKDPQSEAKIERFEIRYSQLDHIVQEYHKVVQEVIMLKQEIVPDEAVSYASLASFEDLTDHIHYIANKFLKKPTLPTPSSGPSQSTHHSTTQIYMPKIELMKFSGEDLTIWPLFYENFRQLVHSKPEFSKAEKLQYLLSSLSGRALKTCASIEPLPDNYDTIFALLKNTYHDKKISRKYVPRPFVYFSYRCQ